VSSIQLRVAAATTALLAGLGMSAVAADNAAAAPSVKKVNCDSGGSLQSALNAVKAGGTIEVSGVCAGNFSIAKNVTVDGAPHATLTGGGVDRVLDIAKNLTVKLSDMTVEDGYSSDGSGIFVGDSAHLLLSDVTVSHNQAYSGGAGLATDDDAVVTAVHSTFSFNSAAQANNTPVTLRGAAIWSGGTVIVHHSTFADNSLTPTSANSAAFGGAIFVVGKLDVTDSTFTRNIVRGITAEGGSINATGSSMKISDSTFTDDQAVASDATDALTATGGSIYSMATTNVLQGVRITGSRAEISGAQGGQALGGAALFAAPATIKASVFKDDVAKGTTTGGNSEILAQGGGLLLEPSATTTISRTTLDGNTVSASSTQGSAYAEGGGAFSFGQLTVSSSTISHNQVAATSGVMANGSGGGIMVSSQVGHTTVTNSTIANNTSAATKSKGAGPSVTTIGSGGGVQDGSETVSFRYDTVAGNSTHATSDSEGGGVDLSPGLGLPKPTTLATIWFGNTANAGPQCAGGLTSAGWNLFGHLSHCTTTTKKTDLTRGHPHLATLASNGGPTRTIALQAGSAALNQIPRTTCRAVVTADQRGVSRPQGAAKKAALRRCDIGAYERVVHHSTRR
jgi:Right handed beta helix region